jgi:hypothetical protein
MMSTDQKGNIAEAAIALAVHPTSNNQKTGVNWATPYEFEARLGQPGAVAQLGERRAGSA